MNIISYDKIINSYNFYIGADTVLLNPYGYPGSVRFMAISRYNAFGEYISDVRAYSYMPDSLFKIKEWVGDVQQRVEELENVLHSDNYGWCHDDI